MEKFKDAIFGLLVDESGDVSHKEQMGIVVRYVNKGLLRNGLLVWCMCKILLLCH